MRRSTKFLLLVLIVMTVSLVSMNFLMGKDYLLGLATGNISIIVADMGAPPTSPTGPSGGGGVTEGGGTSIPELPVKSFKVEPPVLRVLMKEGETSKLGLNITNDGDTNISFTLKIEGVSKYVSLSDTAFKLSPGKSKEVEALFSSNHTGVFTGKIVVEGDLIRKEVPVVIEVESRVVAFDVSLDVPKRDVLPGDEVQGIINIYNLIGRGEYNVTVVHRIKDLRGENVLIEYEIIMIEDRVTYSKSFRLPHNTTPGDYVFVVEVYYNESLGTSSEIFHVNEVGGVAALPLLLYESIDKIPYIITVGIGIIALIILAFIIYERILLNRLLERKVGQKKQETQRRQTRKKSEQDISEAKKRLEKQLVILEKSYSQGRISTDAYRETKDKIKAILKKLED